MLLSSDILCTHYWFVLQSIELTYPEYPNDSIKRKHYDLIQNLPLFLPNKRMGKQFKKKLNEFPVLPYLNSRESFMKWVHFMHNKINRMLGKPEINFYKSLEKYYLNYETKRDKILKKIKQRKKYVSIGVCVFLVIMIFFLYKR